MELVRKSKTNTKERAVTSAARVSLNVSFRSDLGHATLFRSPSTVAAEMAGELIS